MEPAPLCACHGEPKAWRLDSRKTSGGYWRCNIRDQEWHRDRYATDRLHRIGKNLQDNARERAKTLTLRREKFYGSLQTEGLD